MENRWSVRQILCRNINENKRNLNFQKQQEQHVGQHL